MRGNCNRALVCALSFVLIFTSIDSFGVKKRRSYNSSRTVNLWEAQLSLGTVSHVGSYNMASHAFMSKKQRIDSDYNFSIGLSAYRKLNSIVSLGAEFLSGSISGPGNPNDAGTGFTSEAWAAKNMSNTFNELDFVARFDLINLFSQDKLIRPYSVFVKTGMGINAYKHESIGMNLPKDDLEYRAFTIPFGIGGRYDFSDNLGVQLNLDNHFVCSDQFDSTNEQLDGRGMFNEVYRNISVGIVYSFGTQKTKTSRRGGKVKQFWY